MANTQQTGIRKLMSRHKQVNIVIYESSAHGGCYKYAIELFKAYQQTEGVNKVSLLLPRNAEYLDAKGAVEKILLPDNKQGKKWHFLWRQFVNPWLLFRFLKRYNTNNMSRTFVLLNDFEQTSAPLWAPLFRLFLKKYWFGVFLHDADRDGYPPSPKFSAWCMKKMMRLMHIGLYHGSLPERTYYKNTKTLFQKVEHGLYAPAKPDEKLRKQLYDWKQAFSGPILIIPGHIRAEKNYELAFEALSGKANIGLIIAGSPANSTYSVRALKELATKWGVDQQILWIEKYLTEEEMTAALQSADIVLLYYAASFHAQSGILNQVAPLKTPVITGKLENALTQTVEQYNLGWTIAADSAVALSELLHKIHPQDIQADWEAYFASAAWENQTALVTSLIKTLPLQ
jgi:glycosyltransferase involved in cell wall biosynthesis